MITNFVKLSITKSYKIGICSNDIDMAPYRGTGGVLGIISGCSPAKKCIWALRPPLTMGNGNNVHLSSGEAFLIF